MACTQGGAVDRRVTLSAQYSSRSLVANTCQEGNSETELATEIRLPVVGCAREGPCALSSARAHQPLRKTSSQPSWLVYARFLGGKLEVLL
jgi:hypothetical protein